MKMMTDQEIVRLANQAAVQLVASGEESLIFRGPGTSEQAGTLYIQKGTENGLIPLGKIPANDEHPVLFYGIRTGVE